MDDIYSSSRPLTCQQEVQISYRVEGGGGRIICPLASKEKNSDSSKSDLAEKLMDSYH